jgi:hypothetical protein
MSGRRGRRAPPASGYHRCSNGARVEGHAALERATDPLRFPRVTLDFGDEKAEEAIRRQEAALEVARDEIDAIRQERSNRYLESDAKLDKRYELAAHVHDKAQDELDSLLGISPATITARRKREQARDLEREHQTGGSFWSQDSGDPSPSSPAPRRLFPAPGTDTSQGAREDDPKSDVERLADVLGWTRYKVYRNLRRMPGAHKRNPGSTPNNKSWWEIPDPEESARLWRAGVRKPTA